MQEVVGIVDETLKHWNRLLRLRLRAIITQSECPDFLQHPHSSQLKNQTQVRIMTAKNYPRRRHCTTDRLVHESEIVVHLIDPASLAERRLILSRLAVAQESLSHEFQRFFRYSPRCESRVLDFEVGFCCRNFGGEFFRQMREIAETWLTKSIDRELAREINQYLSVDKFRLLTRVSFICRIARVNMPKSVSL